MDEKRAALQALKKASDEKETELLSEIRRLKQQSEKDKAELEKALEKAKEVNVWKRSDSGGDLGSPRAQLKLI